MYRMKNWLMPLLSPDDGGSSTSSGTNSDGKAGENSTGDNSGGSGEKDDKTPKFTQEDLNRIAAREKKQGAASVYKDLGFESEEAAKAAIAAWKKAEDDKKDELTKQKEANAALTKERNEANTKVEALERKFTVMASGVPSQNIDAVVLLASAKMTDGTEFKDAIEEVKKAYPSLFTDTNGNQGTGHGGNPPRNHSGETKGIGERLAEQAKKSSSTKNEYFKN